jgi:hypothetical protein
VCRGQVRGVGAAGSGPRRCAIAQEEAGQAAPPPAARIPTTTWPLRRSPHSFTLSVHARASFARLGLGQTAWRAEGAPLMIVKKILTASVWRHGMAAVGSPRRRPCYGYSGQSNRAQIVRAVLSPSIPIRRRQPGRCPIRGAASDRSFPGFRDRHCLELRSARSGPGP